MEEILGFYSTLSPIFDEEQIGRLRPLQKSPKRSRARPSGHPIHAQAKLPFIGPVHTRVNLTAPPPLRVNAPFFARRCGCSDEASHTTTDHNGRPRNIFSVKEEGLVCGGRF